MRTTPQKPTEQIQTFFKLIVELGSNIHSENSDKFKQIADDYLNYLKYVFAGFPQDKQKLKELGDRIQKEKEIFKGRIHFSVLGMIVKDIFQGGASLKTYLDENKIDKNKFIEQLELFKREKMPDQIILPKAGRTKSGSTQPTSTRHRLFSQPKEEVKEFKYQLAIFKKEIKDAYTEAYEKNESKEYLSAMHYCELAIDEINKAPLFSQNSDIQIQLSNLQGLLAVAATNHATALSENVSLQINHVEESIDYLRYSIDTLENKNQNENDKSNLSFAKRQLAITLNVYANMLKSLSGSTLAHDEMITESYIEALRILENVSPATTLDLENRFQTQENYAEYLYTSHNPNAKNAYDEAQKLLIQLETVKDKLSPEFDLEASKLRLLPFFHLTKVPVGEKEIKENIKDVVKETLAAMVLIKKNVLKMDLDRNTLLKLRNHIQDKLFAYAVVAKGIGLSAENQKEPKKQIEYINLALECFNLIYNKKFLFLKDELLVLKHFTQSKIAKQEKNPDAQMKELFNALNLCNNNTKRYEDEVFNAAYDLLIKEAKYLPPEEALKFLEESFITVVANIKNIKIKNLFKNELLIQVHFIQSTIAEEKNDLDGQRKELFTALSLIKSDKKTYNKIFDAAYELLTEQANIFQQEGRPQKALRFLEDSLLAVDEGVTNAQFKNLLKHELLIHIHSCQSQIDAGANNFDASVKELFKALNLTSLIDRYDESLLNSTMKILPYSISSHIHKGEDPLTAVDDAITRVNSQIIGKKYKHELINELLKLKTNLQARQQQIQPRQERRGPGGRSMQGS